jgi:3-oxoacyl-[acyl-carrier protein] reductase
MMNLSIAKKNAVICGSTQGIGLACAQALAGLGANCILIARNKESLIAAIAQLPTDHGQQHNYAVADFSKVDAVQQAINKITASTTIEILINNSGGPEPGPITEASNQQFQDAFNQHLICNQILSQAVLPGMKASGYGRIINIISTSVKTPLANLGVSNTVRAAVASWAKTLSNEVGQYHITVNNVLPGLTRTLRYDKLVKNIASNGGQTTESIEEGLVNTIPLRRIGTAEEIAHVIAFLASPAASYVTGTSIRVDGGRTPAI